MARAPYKNPPITEAVIELRIKGTVQAKTLEKFSLGMRDHYASQSAMPETNIEIDATSQNVNFKVKNSGFLLASDDQADRLFAKSNSLLVARLAPYMGWSQLFDRLVEGWICWKKIVGNTEVARIGVRYINRIDVPHADGRIDPAKYLLYLPSVPDFKQELYVGFMVRTVSPLRLAYWYGALSSTIAEPPPLINCTSFLLDMDVSRTEDIPMKDEDLWEVIGQARALKNEMFEACITDEARKLFDQ